MADQNPRNEKLRESTEKLLNVTRRTINVASFRANQYKRLVQRKIDLNSLHKKIANTHAELGKIIDDSREAEETNILDKSEVQTLFRRLDSLKSSAIALEQEVAAIRDEIPPDERPEDLDETENR